MIYYAVFDTNVLVSALLTHNKDAATVRVFRQMMSGRIVPLYNEEIIAEYQDVLGRKKFGFPQEDIYGLIRMMVRKGLSFERVNSMELFADQSDAVFYEVALSKDGAFVITGNKKHFPQTPIVVTPSEMLEIMEKTM
jgi:putative PIN family toxin of toxin-antitoxin system